MINTQLYLCSISIICRYKQPGRTLLKLQLILCVKISLVKNKVLFYIFGDFSVNDINCDTSVVHASGAGQLQANSPVAGPRFSTGKPTCRVVRTMGSNDLVIGEDHLLRPSCQRYNWQAGR